MTTLVYEDGVLYTDSYVRTVDKFNCANYVFGEKVYKDPRGTFIFAAYGPQPWHDEKQFKKALFPILGIIFSTINAIKLGAYSIATANEGLIKIIENVNQDLFVPELKFQGLMVTKNHCFLIDHPFDAKDKDKPQLKILENVLFGANHEILALFIGTGMTTLEALKLTAKHADNTGGDIYTYVGSKLKTMKKSDITFWKNEIKDFETN